MYYLVVSPAMPWHPSRADFKFLGVLVIILLLAACLALRAFRMRRRYRTATQLAIARGDPLPVHLRDDYWGLAGLPGFTGGANATATGTAAADRAAKKGKWDRIPRLEEVETAGTAGDRNEELWDDITVSWVLPSRKR